MTIPLHPNYLEMDDYTPGKVFDLLQRREGLANDASLARYLRIAPPVISKVRNRVLAMSDALLIRMHEVSGLSIRELKDACGIPTMEFPRAVQKVDGRLSRWDQSRMRAGLGLTV